jgi:hypothetical protein
LFKEEIGMECDQCNTTVEGGEEREHRGQVLCEDCYLDALSPVRTCDPWAVHSAKALEQHTPGASPLTQIQAEILGVLREAGSIEPPALLLCLGSKITQQDLEREFATLRHMEKVRAERQDNRVLLRLW